MFRYCTKQTLEEIRKLDAEDRHGECRKSETPKNIKIDASQELPLKDIIYGCSYFLDLEVFDLPIPIAVFVVVAWIFICSATFCIWEKDWDYFTAFYFFFICLR